MCGREDPRKDWVGSMDSGASCGRFPQEPFGEESRWVGEWGLLGTGGNSTDNTTQVGVFKPFTKEMLTLPQMAEDSTQAPHSGSWAGELLG